MGFREDLLKKIEKKRGEIADLEAQLKDARTYLQALEDMFKLAAKGAQSGDQGRVAFRAGSMVGKAYDVLRRAGRPMHVNELLPAIGRAVSREDRSALSGTLAAYVRKGDVFTRPAPNTYSLFEFPEAGGTGADQAAPPPGFGSL
jgi:hypothetical protein